MTTDQLKIALGVVIDHVLANVLVDSYVQMQSRYYAGDWKPAELDGGQFCEAVARALYQVDTGSLTTMSVGDICSQLKKVNPPPTHQLCQKDREHFCRILQAIYHFRNDRGVAHISTTPGHDANLMDATLTVATIKWLFCEFLRLTQTLDRDEVVTMIEALIQLEHPLIHELDGQPLVLSTNLTVGEEVLLLLLHSPGGRLSREQLKPSIPATPQAVGMALRRLETSRLIRAAGNGDVVITPLGQQRVREVVLPKTAQVEGAQPARRAKKRSTSHRTTNRDTKRNGLALPESKQHP